MKKIEAIIRKTKFEDVKDALLEADIEWFSYYDVRGIGKSRQARIYRGVMYDTSSIERILISIVVRDKNAEKTVQAIIKSAQTGEIGDGRIFVILANLLLPLTIAFALGTDVISQHGTQDEILLRRKLAQRFGDYHADMPSIASGAFTNMRPFFSSMNAKSQSAGTTERPPPQLPNTPQI